MAGTQWAMRSLSSHAAPHWPPLLQVQGGRYRHRSPQGPPSLRSRWSLRPKRPIYTSQSLQVRDGLRFHQDQQAACVPSDLETRCGGTRSHDPGSRAVPRRTLAISPPLRAPHIRGRSYWCSYCWCPTESSAWDAWTGHNPASLGRHSWASSFFPLPKAWLVLGQGREGTEVLGTQTA